MPFEPGNQLAAKRRIFEGAIKRALAQDNADRLRRACERLLDSAADGETWTERMAALTFLAERLDGKVLAMPADVGDGALQITWIMHGSAPTTIEHASQAPALEASSVPGPIPRIGEEAPGHAELVESGGVGGGGVTPTHTVVTPVPSDSGGA